MNFAISLILLSLLSISDKGQNNNLATYNEFQKTSAKTVDDLKNDFILEKGQPEELEQKKYNSYQVFDKKRSKKIADLLTDEHGTILEKNYKPDSPLQITINEFKKLYFSNLSFEEIPVKCTHRNPLYLHLSKNKEVYILINEEKFILQVSFPSQTLIEKRLLIEKNKKCKNRWE